MTQDNGNFELGYRPSEISEPPRDSNQGTVTDEVGIRYEDCSEDYWKVIQRIEDDGSFEVRLGYYKKCEDGWHWIPNSLMLPPVQLIKIFVKAIPNVIQK